jgi:hypothetical protein
MSDRPWAAAMDRFVNRENIERYRKVTSELINDPERLRILKLLAAEGTKFKLEFEVAAAVVRVPNSLSQHD